MSGLSKYGFDWGPMTVERTGHIEDRGYALTIETDHARIEVYVTEAGRRIRVFDQKKPGYPELVAT